MGDKLVERLRRGDRLVCLKPEATAEVTMVKPLEDGKLEVCFRYLDGRRQGHVDCLELRSMDRVRTPQ